MLHPIITIKRVFFLNLKFSIIYQIEKNKLNVTDSQSQINEQKKKIKKYKTT